MTFIPFLPFNIRYTCPTCAWSVTLSTHGENVWTQNGVIAPRCRKCDVVLRREMKK